MPQPRSSDAAARNGLTREEAARRLAADGPNELPRTGQRTLWGILRDVAREPMLMLLLVGGAVYLMFGDTREALFLLFFATLSVVITVVQETRTERVLEALRDLTSPRALVIRDGERQRIPGREVVRGDLILLAEGDRVPADARLIECEDLRADESLLTGESVAVSKHAAAAGQSPAAARPGGDDLPFVFSGALIVRGTGLAEVTATGGASEIGRIGLSLAGLETEQPRLRAQTQAMVQVFGILGGLVAVGVVVLYGALRGDWLEAALAGIALGMAMLPEEFPLVLTVFMAMGAWRISQARVLTRRAASIESLGSATVLCTDKTGTLTENRMSVQEVRLPGRVVEPTGIPDATIAAVARCGLLASAPTPYDPMDTAFHDLAARQGVVPDGAAPLTLVRTFGMRPDRLAVVQLWHGGGDGIVAAAKGAPEAIAMLCRSDPETRDWLRAETDAMAARGLRVLGLAEARLADGSDPARPEDIAFRLLGLAGLADPVRDSVPDAVRDCRTAGIHVVMITGDYPVTARSIASEAGLKEGRVVTGEEISGMDDAALREAVTDATVFARVMPEQKLRIVQALKAQGEIVAMTGDGVNDAPSLKAAHIGIAMGRRGTDVAREASAIVLLDDDFGSIVRAIRLGRRIYDNLRKAMGFILAVHIPIAGVALLPLVFGMPIIFGPLHIAFLEMIIDPVCALVFEAEPEEDDTMRRPPRAPDTPLFSSWLIGWSVVQGVVVLAMVVAVYFVGYGQGMPEPELRGLTFLALVIGIVSLVYLNRSFGASPLAAILRPNPMLVFVPLAVAAALTVVLGWSEAAQLFDFAPPAWADIGRTLVAGIAAFLVLELLKVFSVRHLRA